MTFRRRFVLPLVLVLVAASAGYTYGTISFVWNLFPKPAVELIYKAIYWGRDTELFVNDLNSVRAGPTDIADIIDGERLPEKYRALVDFVTKGDPALLGDVRLETSQSLDINIPLDPASAASIEFFVFRNVIGVNHVALIRPQESADKLLIYQEGHFNTANLLSPAGVPRHDAVCARNACLHNNISDLLNRFLADGYTIAILWLPWFGPNQPGLVSSRFGTFEVNHFGWFRLAIDDDAERFQAMLMPISAVINELEMSDVTLVGLSYGANIVPVAAALDHRIKRSYAVDGGPPLFVKHLYPRLKANLEDSPGLRDIVNTLELFLIAGSGEERKFVQMINRFVLGSYMEVYRADLEAIADENGSCFRGVFDENKIHEVSDFMIDHILADTNTC